MIIVTEVSHPRHRCFCLKYGFLLRIVDERQTLPVLRYEKNSQECHAMKFPSHLRLIFIHIFLWCVAAGSGKVPRIEYVESFA